MTRIRSAITPLCRSRRDATRPASARFYRLPLRALLLLALAWAGPLLADSSDNASRLKELGLQIRALQQDLAADRQQKQDQQSELREAETRIGKQISLLKALNEELRLQQRELERLQGERGVLQKDLQHHRVQLVQQIRSAYAIGQQEYIKMLLNQQDPAAVTRTLTYYDYFHRARLARMQALDAKLEVLAAVEDAIQSKRAELEQNRETQEQERQALEGTRESRSQLLASLDTRIRDKSGRLDQLLADQERLQRLLKELADAPRTPVSPDQFSNQPFAKSRGKLPWPTAGDLVARYGNPRQEGNLKWQGVLIEAAEGADVRAISHGRVAFSDWLRGFGLLTIIDHGDGYMSLYGGNQSLYKEVGDWVDAGDVIAGVGNSGGRQDPALYFEIRHNGKPTNPLKWCLTKPKKIAKG